MGFDDVRQWKGVLADRPKSPGFCELDKKGEVFGGVLHAPLISTESPGLMAARFRRGPLFPLTTSGPPKRA